MDAQLVRAAGDGAQFEEGERSAGGPLPLAGRAGWGCERPSSPRLAPTPPPPTPPRKGEESRVAARGACRAASSCADRVPSPLRGGPGWGCRRPSSPRLAPTPPPPTPPRKGEESRVAARGACRAASSCADRVPSPLRGGPGWGCERPSSPRLAPTPPPPTPPRKGEESRVVLRPKTRQRVRAGWPAGSTFIRKDRPGATWASAKSVSPSSSAGPPSTTAQ